jgi:hypothetical protein
MAMDKIHVYLSIYDFDLYWLGTGADEDDERPA